MRDLMVRTGDRSIHHLRTFLSKDVKMEMQLPVRIAWGQLDEEPRAVKLSSELSTHFTRVLREEIFAVERAVILDTVNVNLYYRGTMWMNDQTCPVADQVLALREHMLTFNLRVIIHELRAQDVANNV